jgi:chaperonin GroEL
MYRAVSTTYGPKGRNAQIEKPYGRFLLTRDGVTVARDTYFSNRGQNMGSQVLLEASETTNRLAGDGTSATVVLGYHLMRQGVQAIAGGKHEMDIKEQLLADSRVILAELAKISSPVKAGQLKQVATVSSGDGLLGELIAEAVERVGPDGGIITEKAYTQGIKRDYVDGYYLQSGFTALESGRKELADPHVIVSIKSVTSGADVVDLLTMTVKMLDIKPGTIPRLLFVGNFEDAAYNLICDNINRGTIDAVILRTPAMFGEMGKQLLEDIAAYAGCEPLTDTTNLKNFDQRYVGTVDKVRASKTESTLFADNTTDLVSLRVEYLRNQLQDEVVDAIAEKLRDRLSKLEGKIALFKIGGATDTAKEEVEFRVEDAIHATRAAYTDGVVAGGGATLLALSKLDISEVYRKALQETFKQLLLNANLPAEVKLHEALAAPTGSGFDLRNGHGEVIDMVAAGVLDPTKVVSQTVTNATQAAADALTTGIQLIFEDTEPRR